MSEVKIVNASFYTEAMQARMDLADAENNIKKLTNELDIQDKANDIYEKRVTDLEQKLNASEARVRELEKNINSLANRKAQTLRLIDQIARRKCKAGLNKKTILSYARIVLSGK